MSELADVITEEVECLLDSEEFRSTIRNQITKNVANAIDSSMTFGSAFRKQIDAKLKEVIYPAIEQFDFSEYVVKLNTVLTSLLNQSLLNEYRKILEQFQTAYSVPEKSEWTVKELFDKYVECCGHDIDTNKCEVNSDSDYAAYDGGEASLDIYNAPLSDAKILEFKSSVDDDLNRSVRFFHVKAPSTYKVSYTAVEDLHVESLSSLSQFDLFILNLRSYNCTIEITSKDESTNFADFVEVEAEPELTYV